MKRAFALAIGVLLALAILITLMLSSNVSRPESRGVQSSDPPAPLQDAPQPLDTTLTELARAPAIAIPDSTTPIEGPPATGRAAVSGRAPIVLFGTLTDSSDKKSQSLRGDVRITDARGAARLVPIENGGYSAEALAAGAIDVGVEAPGFRRVARAITLGASETEHREDFALDPTWTIAVRFLTPDGRNLLDDRVDGKPMLGETLWALATEGQPSDHLPPGVSKYRSKRSRWAGCSRSDGKILGDAKNECYGTLDVDGAPPIYVSAVLLDRVVATTLVDASVDQLTIEIPLERLEKIRCGIKGRIVDGTTLLPVPNATTWLSGNQGMQLRTDANGEFSRDDILPGIYTLQIMRMPEYAMDLRRVQLAPGRQNDLGAIPLERSVTLRGRCVDPLGLPAQADVELSPYLPDHPFELPNSKFGMETEASGRFELGICAHRVYVLHVGPSRRAGTHPPEWRAKRTIVDLTEGPIDDLVIQVHLAVDVILRPATDEVRQERYWIFTPEGLVASQGAFADSGVARERLAPGNYKLLLGEEASILREIPFTLGEEPMTLDVGK